MPIIKHRIIFYIFSIILFAASIFALSVWGLNYGIDFKGGTAIELQPNASTTITSSTDIKTILEQTFPEGIVRPYGERGFLIHTQELDSVGQAQARADIAKNVPTYEVARLDTVGPVLGDELKKKSVTSIVLVLIAIVLFIAFAFRQVSKPVSSWKYGFAAIVALFHDVIIPMGFFAAMGHFFGGYEVDALFVTALLVVLGFSVHDTIVVFDRVRENLRHQSDKNEGFDKVVGRSVSETFIRSVNTSLTTILALIAVYVWGPETTRNFSLVLIVGILAGTYSSIFIGSALLVTMAKGKKK